MNKKLFIFLSVATMLCILFTACGKECATHIFDSNNVCTICGYKAPADNNGNSGDNTDVGNNDNEDDNTSDGNITPEEVFTVSFDSNGGTKVASQTVTNGKKATKPADPVKTGYTFDGWYYGDEKWSFVGYVVTEDMTLTAKWSVNVYTVSFVDHNGSYLYSVEVEHGDKITAPEKPTKEGCTFIGWFNGKASWSFKKNKVTEDIVLQQKWSTEISYDLNGGTNDSRNPTKIYSDDSFPIYLYEPVREGYTFAGWCVEYIGADFGYTYWLNSIDYFKAYTLKATWIADGNESSNYPWTTTRLIFQMTENSNQQELPSTCRRYLAGDIDGVSDVSTIDQWVSDRNDAALRETNVEIEYQYLPDTSKYNWGNNIDEIDSEVRSKAPGRPDMYCNFIYDMVAVSLKGSFANLLSTTMYPDGHELAGLNYFAFADDPNLTDTGDGYMIEYMRSLTLSKFKMYCLASDYFIDTTRAALVVPVNIALLETLLATGDYDYASGTGDFLADRILTYDYDGNAKLHYTIEDFYQLVYDREWNYETLAQFSSAIFMEGYEGDDQADLRDTVGFALGTGSGLGAAGLLYSTSITIIDRAYDVAKGDYTYSYPYMVQTTDSYGNVYFERDYAAGTHDELIAFCDNLTALFNSQGVIAVSPVETFGYGYTDIKAIRARFASNNILFGGIVTLGSLEYDEYRYMNGAGGSGYGIAPIPLYRSGYVDPWTGEVMKDDYRTVISNIGKIGAISYTTENFAQCTAYLNYQSTHSTEILNEYYDYKLQYDVIGTGVKGNVEMLKYIRANIRSSFDMTFEDALGKFYSATDYESMNQQWHTQIKNCGYGQYDTIHIDRYYDELTPLKAWRLYNLENAIYTTLPD